jgi:hypothetical protein
VSSGAHFGVEREALARRKESAARYKFELEKQIAAQKAAKEAAAREARRTLELEEARVEAEREALMRRFKKEESRDDIDVPVAPVVEQATPIEHGSVRSMASMWQRRVETLATHE